MNRSIPDSKGNYQSFTPAKNDGKTVYTIRVPKDVPVKDFWSVSAYNKKGYFERTPTTPYSINKNGTNICSVHEALLRT